MALQHKDDDGGLSPLLLRCRHEKLSIDEVLQKWAGELGRAQLLHFTLVSLAWCLYAFLTLIMVFSDKTPQWACITTTNRTSSSTIIPLDGSASCDSSFSICSMDSSLWEWVGDKRQSTVSQWGLICGQGYKVGLVHSVYFTGALLGAGIYGSLSDSFLGRKGVLVVACCLSSLCGLLTAFSPSYWVYLLLRGSTGFNCGGIGQTSFVLATEPIGPSKRGPMGMSTFFFFSVGIMLLSSIAYFNSSWRHLYLIISALCILYCLLVLPFLNESPRWCLARGKINDALAILKQIAEKNGRAIPSEITLNTEQVNTQDDINEHFNQPQTDQAACSNATVLDIFRVSTTRTRMVILLFIWLGNGLLYYGINLNIPNVTSNSSLGLFLNAVAEVPAVAITAVMLEKFGRRPLLVFAMLVAGACSLTGALISKLGDEVGTSIENKVCLACGVIAIFGLASSYNLIFIYTAELFPTVVRNAAMGLATQAAQVGAIASPFVVALGGFHEWLPWLFFSAAALIGAWLALWLPETLQKPMYETMEDMLRS